MRGLMMDDGLLISNLIDYAAENHSSAEIVSRSVEGPIHKYTYEDACLRSMKLANALTRLGVGLGDRVATMAWNGYRHFELYYGVSGMGAVCHTINPRLFPEQIIYIINHAADRFVFTDLTFMPLFEALHDKLPTVEGYVVMTDRAHMPDTPLPKVLCYEELLDAEDAHFSWPQFDERTASSLCYTSGTTGNPKGALYSHRSTILHTMFVSATDGLGISNSATILPAVPMFHVNAWGIPYAATMYGSKLVLPGSGYDGKSMYELLDGEKVEISAGVPTIWLMLLDYLRKEGKTLDHLKTAAIGGAAAPLSMIEAFEDEFGVHVHHAWGMTEISPVGTTAHLNKRVSALPTEERRKFQMKQGREVCGVKLKILDDEGNELPRDGKAFGELAVRGPWVISAYFNDADATAAQFTDDGWFLTGDVATLDKEGHMQIVDRSKDVIKSGGEWISSIDLENAAVGHSGVAEAAVIGLPHPKWDERPLMIVVRAAGSEVEPNEIKEFLSDKVAKWWLPDDIVFIDELPHTATGKLAKIPLRERYKDHKFSTA